MSLRIMIGAGNYPKLSESYIEAEIRYLLRKGIEVAVWSDKVGSPEAPNIVEVFRGTVTEAIAKWKPSVFHAHYLTFAGWAFDQAKLAGVPCTVRGHSFDYGPDRARILASKPEIRRVWLFPHFAAEVAHPKVFPLPVAYDSSLYKQASGKDRRLVYRTAAAKPGKGLEEFFQIKDKTPGFAFDLTANVVLGDELYLPFLEKTAQAYGVSFTRNVGREEAVRRMNRAGIYLDTSDPKGHAFGMPISIAEALATGCYVLAKGNAASEEYLGGAGRLYHTENEAAAFIKETESWDGWKWAEISEAAVKRAQAFSDETVLSAEVAFWKSL
jgi:glycosyltransferase involved in cell wall biosynthesis